MQIHGKKYYEFIILAILCAVCMGLFLNLGIRQYELRSVVSRSQSFQEHNAVIRNIIKSFESEDFSTTSHLIDYVRVFVFSNSNHGYDGRGSDDPIVAIWNYCDNRDVKPALTCGPRAYAMKNILDELGIANRIVHIFNDDGPYVRSHTFLEVFNDDFNGWEIHDPDLNLYYVHNETDKRLSAAEIVFGDLQKVLPIVENEAGWDLKGAETLKSYFGAVMYDFKATFPLPVILINTDRFDVSRRFPGNRYLDEKAPTFVEYARRTHVNPIILFDKKPICGFLLKIAEIFSIRMP